MLKHSIYTVYYFWPQEHIHSTQREHLHTFACPLCPQKLIQYNCVSHTHEVWTWLCTCSFCSQSRYSQAKLSIHDRTLKVAAVVESLEREMELLCLTGVEDQLQADVRPTLEMLRNAGIKVQPASSGCQNCFLTESNSLFPWNTVLGCSMGWQLSPHYLSRLAPEVLTVPSSRLLSDSFFFHTQDSVAFLKQGSEPIPPHGTWG